MKTWTTEARAKIAEANRRRVWTDEARAKLAAAHRGHPDYTTAEGRAKTAAANRGRHLSEEHRARLSAIRKGRPAYDSSRKGAAEYMRNRVVKPESVAKQAAFMCHWWQNWRASLSEEERQRLADRHITGSCGHRATYEATFGPIPAGYVVHHIDGDKRNNDPSNLALLTRGEHTRLHNLLRLGAA